MDKCRTVQQRCKQGVSIGHHGGFHVLFFVVPPGYISTALQQFAVEQRRCRTEVGNMMGDLTTVLMEVGDEFRGPI